MALLTSGLGPHRRRRYPEDAPQEAAGGPLSGQYVPGDHKVADVLEHASQADSGTIREIIDAEREGKNRSTLLASLEDLLLNDPADEPDGPEGDAEGDGGEDGA